MKENNTMYEAVGLKENKSNISLKVAVVFAIYNKSLKEFKNNFT